MTAPLYMNGRVLLRDRGGVRRYAAEVAHHLTDCTVLQPRSAARPWSGRVWEQTTLRRSTTDGVLLNPAHGGPLRHPCQVSVVHDLLALTEPSTVNRVFGALMKAQLPRLVAASSKVATVSAHVATEVAHTFDLPARSIEVVPPGISDVFGPGDTQAARGRLGLDIDRPVVAALLDPTPRKNSRKVAQLLNELEGVQVVVAGRDRAAAFARTAGTGSSNAVPKAGYLDLGEAADIEVATMYQAADVFVSLTSAEGFGLPAVEAAMCGAAVVSTPVPSLVEHAPNAAVLVSSAIEAQRAIESLVEEPARREELVARARLALGDLRWAKTAATLEDMMTQAARA